MSLNEFGLPVDKEEKAGYNTAADIALVLGTLRKTFTSATLQQPNDFELALQSCRAVMNIISGKVPEKEYPELDSKVFELELKIPATQEVYKNSEDGNIYFKKVQERINMKKELEILWRKLERLMNRYEYGMFSKEDPSRAIYKK